MSLGFIGSPTGNTILPISNFTQQTKELILTVTGTNWTTSRAVGIFYADSNGVWRLRFNIEGAFSPSTSNPTIVVSNVAFKSGIDQALTLFANGTAPYTGSAFTASSGSIYIYSANPLTAAMISGDVELDSNPTTYTTAANLENNVNVAAYFPNASTTPGLLSYYQEDDTTCAANTFSGSAGGAASPVCALKIRRVGSLVSVLVPTMASVVPTSNSDHLISSIAVPSWARPVLASYTSITVSNNGNPVTTVVGIMGVQSNGLIYVYRDMTATAFTNSQNAGWSVPYTLTYSYGV